jgi:hypothetical protein
VRSFAVQRAAVLTVLVLLAVAAPAAADGTATWQSAPAQPPPPPPGASPSPYPVPIGSVGDIEFWAPNRGVLITAGTSLAPAGLYAYNGADWHLLSTVCGGTDGRIAWAGPDEFWTISDQRPGQVLPNGGYGALADVSLCHFSGGEVVGSYALPLDQPNSYKAMNAAACDVPNDCWFGGDLDGNGAFHLHWDGTTVSVVDEPQDHQIASMTVDQGQIYESVQLTPTDSYAGEDANHPPVVHVIVPTDPVNPFHSLFPPDMQDPSCGGFCPPLPEYGTNTLGQAVAPDTLGGLALSSDSNAGAADPQLWAAAGFDGVNAPGQGEAHPVVLRYVDGTWTQIVPNLVQLPGVDTPLAVTPGNAAPESVAAEPNTGAAWIAVIPGGAGDGQAHVDRVEVTGPAGVTATGPNGATATGPDGGSATGPDGGSATGPNGGSATGAVGATVTDQDVLGTAQGVGPRGNAKAIACPAAQDCWLATDGGWLFHLSDGTQWPQDTDPNFAGIITYRPPDSGVPVVIPQGPGFDQLPPPPSNPGGRNKRPRRRILHPKPIVTHMGDRLVGTTLQLSFTLTKKAHVQLIARRHHAVVAQTRNLVLAPGRHTLSLSLNVRRWPTSLKLNAIPIAATHKPRTRA